MARSNTLHGLATLILATSGAAEAAAQRGSGSLDAASPEITTLGIEPGEIAVMDDTCMPETVWSAAALGLAPGDEVDAFSDVNNTFPAFGPALAPPGSLVVVAFSVNRTAAGMPGSVVAAEAVADGAACDVYEQRFSTAAEGVTLAEDARCLTPCLGAAQGMLESASLPRTGGS